ncbi:MAG: hypothetical protein WAO26_10535 [Porticoccaceae bacterium]
MLYRRGLQLEEAIKSISEISDDPAIKMFLTSLAHSTRGIIR